MIQPSGDGAFRVIGGAGGKLNYLKLTGVKPESDYKESAARAAAANREKKKREREQDKKMGLTESKVRAREALKAQVGDHGRRRRDTLPTKWIRRMASSGSMERVTKGSWHSPILGSRR